MLEKTIRLIRSYFGIELIGLHRRPAYDGEKDRYSYQAKYHQFEIGAEEKVLDVGSGAYPFPYATMLVDLYTENTEHRHDDLRTDGKPFKVADINHLPFEDKSYDFVYCSHLLEHVEDPVRACAELMRVGKRGYVETPSLMSDVLFSWAKGMHKWITFVIADRIVFFEYSKRIIQGVRNPYWGESVFSRRHHPLQNVFYNNMDIFNNSLLWWDYFNYSVFYLDGLMVHSDLSTRKR